MQEGIAGSIGRAGDPSGRSSITSKLPDCRPHDNSSMQSVHLTTQFWSTSTRHRALSWWTWSIWLNRSLPQRELNAEQSCKHGLARGRNNWVIILTKFGSPSVRLPSLDSTHHSQANKKIKTLHKLGACFMLAWVDLLSCQHMGTAMPHKSDFEVVCKWCA